MTEKEIDQQLFGQPLPERSMGAMEALGKGIGAALEGFGKGVEIAGNIMYGDGMQHFAAHGAHEIATAIFGHGESSGFVMYPRNPGTHDNGQEEVQQDHQQELSQGREM